MDAEARIAELVKEKGRPFSTEGWYELRNPNGTWYVDLGQRSADGRYQLGYGSPQYCVKSPTPKTPDEFLTFLNECVPVG